MVISLWNKLKSLNQIGKAGLSQPPPTMVTFSLLWPKSFSLSLNLISLHGSNLERHQLLFFPIFSKRLNSVRSWRKALLLRQPMKTGHVILLLDVHSSTSLFCFFLSLPVPSVTLYFILWIFKDKTFIIWVSMTDFLSHTKSQPTQKQILCS